MGSVLGQITTTSCLPVSGDRARDTHDGKTASQPSLFGNSIALSFEGLGLSRYPKFNLSRASTQQPADFFCKEFQPGQHRQEAPFFSLREKISKFAEQILELKPQQTGTGLLIRYGEVATTSGSTILEWIVGLLDYWINEGTSF